MRGRRGNKRKGRRHATEDMRWRLRRKRTPLGIEGGEKEGKGCMKEKRGNGGEMSKSGEMRRGTYVGKRGREENEKREMSKI